MMRDAKDICGAITVNLVLLSIGVITMVAGFELIHNADIGMVGVMITIFATVNLAGWSGHMDLYFKHWQYWWYQRTRK